METDLLNTCVSHCHRCHRVLCHIIPCIRFLPFIRTFLPLASARLPFARSLCRDSCSLLYRTRKCTSCLVCVTLNLLLHTKSLMQLPYAVAIAIVDNNERQYGCSDIVRPPFTFNIASNELDCSSSEWKIERMSTPFRHKDLEYETKRTMWTASSSFSSSLSHENRFSLMCYKRNKLDFQLLKNRKKKKSVRWRIGR